MGRPSFLFIFDGNVIGVFIDPFTLRRLDQALINS